MMYDVPCTLFIGVHLVYNRDSCIRVPVYHVRKIGVPRVASAKKVLTFCDGAAVLHELQHTHGIPSPRRHL